MSGPGGRGVHDSRRKAELMFRRSQFLAVAGAACVAPRAVGAQPLTRLRLASAPDEDIVGALWAQSSGAFRKAGLDVDIQKANSGSAVAAGVVGGALEIGKSSMVSLLTAHSRGVPFVIIAPAAVYNAEAPVTGLIVAKDSPYKTARDLNGKTFSVSSLNDQYQISIMKWLDQNGGDSKTVRFLELPTAAAPEAVAGGRVDAATIATPHLAEAVASGKCRILARPFTAIGNRWIFASYFTTADFAAKNKDVITRFRRTVLESSQFANDHHADTVDVIAKFTGIEPKVIAGMTRTTVGTTLDPRLMTPIIEAAAAYKAIPKVIDPKELVDPGALA